MKMGEKIFADDALATNRFGHRSPAYTAGGSRIRASLQSQANVGWNWPDGKADDESAWILRHWRREPWPHVHARPAEPSVLSVEDFGDAYFNLDRVKAVVRSHILDTHTGVRGIEIEIPDLQELPSHGSADLLRFISVEGYVPAQNVVERVNALRTDPPHPVGEQNHQTELPLLGEFAPSKQLLKLWMSGIRRHVAEAVSLDPEATKQVYVPTGLVEQSKEFSFRLRNVIVITARMLSYSREMHLLSLDGRFVPSFVSRINQRFLVPADMGTEFFSALFVEMKQWLAPGRKYAGTWGELVLDEGGDFRLRAKRAAVKRKRGFVPADLPKGR